MEFTPRQLLALETASAQVATFLAVQYPNYFRHEESRTDIGDYPWDVALFKILSDSCTPHPGDFTSTIVPDYRPGELQIFPTRGEPGAQVTIIGHGFEPFTAIESVKSAGSNRHLARTGRRFSPMNGVILRLRLLFQDWRKAMQSICGTGDGTTTVATEFWLLWGGSIGPVPLNWYVRDRFGDSTERQFCQSLPFQ